MIGKVFADDGGYSIMKCLNCGKDAVRIVKELQAEVERLQNQLDHISFESYTLTISQANKRLHSKVEDLQAEVERLRKVFMHCIETGVMTQDAYEIYDELKAKAEGGEG
jgi:hypothetical protein